MLMAITPQDSTDTLKTSHHRVKNPLLLIYIIPLLGMKIAGLDNCWLTIIGVCRVIDHGRVHVFRNSWLLIQSAG